MTELPNIVTMLIICWIPQNDGSLKEGWRIQQTVTLEHCLQINQLSSGGHTAAITVRCGVEK